MNILKGETLSICGTAARSGQRSPSSMRPMLLNDLRLQIKAGLTGFAQLHRYNTSPYDKLQMDLMYIANQSLLQDLKIMFQTVKVLLMFGESTQGVVASEGVREKESA